MASRLGVNHTMRTMTKPNILRAVQATPSRSMSSAFRCAARSFSQLRDAPTFTRPASIVRISRSSYRQSKRPHTYQQTRQLTTETKDWVLSETRAAIKWTTIAWTALGLGGVIWFGLQLEWAEKENPTPAEWTFWTRQSLRDARAIYDTRKLNIGNAVDYAGAGLGFAEVLRRLEDDKIDGQDLDNGGDIYVPGVGTAGVNFSAKSWAWRAAYVETVMSLGKCAENCDELVLDTTRGIVFSREVIIGPSNPDPRPVPTGSSAAPLEENCIRPLDAPETYYMRILTGTGFTTKHKLDAALAYASWLEHQNLHDSAGEMYEWGVDIALRALPDGIDASRVIDDDSGVLKAGSEATANILTASTALAKHHAIVGNVSEALPILLSVLRARRTAPVSTRRPPSQSLADYPPPRFSWIWSTLFREPDFTQPPPSGDTPITRVVEQATCDDAELMIYIGEILFASAAGKSQTANRDQGLSWTRQAVSVAEANLTQDASIPGSTPRSRADNQKKCQQCLNTAVGNWETMLERLLEQTHATPEKKSWFGRSKGSADHTEESLLADIARVAVLKDRLVRQRSAE